MYHTILDPTHVELHVGQEYNGSIMIPFAKTPTNKQLHFHGGHNKEDLQREMFCRIEHILVLYESHNTLIHSNQIQNRHIKLSLEGQPGKQ